jgi:hypothetical protein
MSAAKPRPANSVKSLRMLNQKGNPVVEIIGTKPLIPSIQPLNDPPRLVIDLPDARIVPKKIGVNGTEIRSLRADQFQDDPPVARVVLDLVGPHTYTWESTGNRLLIHLKPNGAVEALKPVPPTTELSPPKAAPAPEVVATSANAPISLTANPAGGSLSAVDDTTSYKLQRGGEVHVCPRTAVSMTPAQNGHNLMFGLNTGAFEIHYPLDTSSDSLMTPDFRIVFPGPGEFHYAVSVDNRGNTCVRSLPGNTASAIVSELIGDRSYQVKATDQLVFHTGHLDQVDMAVPLECGCPPVRQPVERASAQPPAVVQSSAAPNAPPTPISQPPVSNTATAPQPSAAPAASEKPSDVKVQVDAPFVFRASGPPPDPAESARSLKPELRTVAPPETAPLPPPPAQKAGVPEATTTPPPRRGLFHKIGGFFASLFR